MGGGLFCGKEKQKNHSLSMLDLFQTALCHLEFDDSIELVCLGEEQQLVKLIKYVLGQDVEFWVQNCAAFVWYILVTSEGFVVTTDA